MRTISIINQKGGCGKTTTSINLAACMARLGHKTLLVDMDPQGHCGVGLAVPEDQIERSVYETLIEEGDGRVAKLGEIIWQIPSTLTWPHRTSSWRRLSRCSRDGPAGRIGWPRRWIRCRTRTNGASSIARLAWDC